MTTKKNRKNRNTKKKNINHEDDILTDLKRFITSRKLKKAKAKKAVKPAKAGKKAAGRRALGPGGMSAKRSGSAAPKKACMPKRTRSSRWPMSWRQSWASRYA